MSQETEQIPEANTASVATRSAWSYLANISLGLWGFYFIAKLFLYWKELIGFHTLANLAFAAFILFPVKSALWRRIKFVATILVAVALLYYDSWLPPIDRVISQASLVSSFSSTYLIELAGRFINPVVVAMLVAAGVAYWLVSRWVRLDIIVIAVTAAAPLVVFLKTPAPDANEQINKFAQFEQADKFALAEQPTTPVPQESQPARPVQAGSSGNPAPQEPFAQGGEQSAGNDDANGNPDLNKVLKDFFAQEGGRSVSFPAPKADTAPFDVVFIHVCSLSWDDVRVAGLEHHPLWGRFDIVLKRFNTASSYSGPAAIRMLRATCGQPSHERLYAPAADKCYLMGSLKRSGFEPGLAMNHNGHFDKFLETVQTLGHLNVPPFPFTGVKIYQYAFDDTPIYDDLSLLTHWMESRQKSGSSRAALFYNTASLHDGNHLTGAYSNLNSQENFKIRLTKLLDDVEAFFQILEKSGRRAVVAMIPEHGAALRGDKMQIAGLREIPSSAITLVPVGIKVIGPGLQRTGRSLAIDKPTSYLAVSQIVARLLDKPPFAHKTFSPSDYVADLPATPFVSQNESVVMVGYRQRYYLRQGSSEWLDYTDF